MKIKKLFLILCILSLCFTLSYSGITADKLKVIARQSVAAGGGPTTLNVLPNEDQYLAWDLTGESTAWEATDDPVGTPDDGTTEAHNDANYETFRLGFVTPSFSATTVEKIRVTVRGKMDVGADNILVYLRVNGTNYGGADGILIDLTTSWAEYITAEWTDNPETDTAWTEADLEETSGAPFQGVNFQTQSLDASEIQYITQTYITIFYTP